MIIVSSCFSFYFFYSLCQVSPRNFRVFRVLRGEWTLMVFAVGLAAAPAQAQEFAPGGIADPREPRIGIGFLSSDLFADSLALRSGQQLPNAPKRENHGVVQLGVSRALVRLGKIELGIQGSAISRFRIDTSDNDALSVDYLIALPVTFSIAGTQGRVRMIHRSAHLGDELVQNSTIRRLEFDHEEIDVLLSRDFGHLRLYGGGALTVASSYENDDGGLQAGLEGSWKLSPRYRARAGADWQRSAISGWRDQINAVAGIGAGSVRLQARFHTGATHLGEFFGDREKAWGAEVIFEF